jgi:hypothetical protein
MAYIPAMVVDALRGSLGPWLGATRDVATRQRTMWRLKLIAGFTVLVPVFVSWPLWTAERAFPLVPAIPGLVAPAWAHGALFAAWLAVMVGMICSPAPRGLCFAASAFGVAMVLLDQNRLQPWLYQFLVLFVALGCVDWRGKDESANRGVWAIFAFTLAMVYFYSGVQKAHPGFGTEVAARLMEPFVGEAAWVPRAGMAIPAIEAAMGLLILFGPTRRFGAVLTLGMHAFILVVLGPFGMNYNPVVWPWNLGMMALAWVALWRSDPLLPWLAHRRAAPAVLLFGVMPLANLAGVWDAYMSFSLYSARTAVGFIDLRPGAAARLPESYLPYLRPRPDGNQRLDVLRWSLDALRAPVYPEPRVLRGVADSLCRYGIGSDEIGLVLIDPPPLFGRRPPPRVVACCRG